MFNTVLFPLDESRESRDAVDTVMNIVKTYNSRLVLLSVVEQQAVLEESNEATFMASTEAVAKLLKEAQIIFAEKGISAEIIEKRGIPSFTICDVADELGADLIIMGCRGLGLTTEGAHDSVTTKVINLSPCPVLIVP